MLKFQRSLGRVPLFLKKPPGIFPAAKGHLLIVHGKRQKINAFSHFSKTPLSTIRRYRHNTPAWNRRLRGHVIGLHCKITPRKIRTEFVTHSISSTFLGCCPGQEMEIFRPIAREIIDFPRKIQFRYPITQFREKAGKAFATEFKGETQKPIDAGTSQYLSNRLSFCLPPLNGFCYFLRPSLLIMFL